MGIFDQVKRNVHEGAQLIILQPLSTNARIEYHHGMAQVLVESVAVRERTSSIGSI
jgi:hypothetical protein